MTNNGPEKYCVRVKCNGNIGSGVLIAGETTFYVFTAAHCLGKEEPKIETLTRAERRAKRNEDKNKVRDDDGVGEFQTLESAQRQKFEWWGTLTKEIDLNGLHHSSKRIQFYI